MRDIEVKYCTLIENAGDAIFIADAETGIILEVNRRAEELLGMPRHKLVGLNQTELHPKEDTEEYRSNFQELIREGRAVFGDLFVRHADGRRIPVEISGSVTEVGGRRLIFGIFRDATARKAEEERLRKLSRVVKESPALVMVTDAEGKIAYVNPKFTEVTGYSLDEVRGRNPRILNSGEQPAEFYADLWETIRAGREWRGEFHNKRKSGELYWARSCISPLKDRRGEITHFIAVTEDVTEQKKAEEALRESQRTLSILMANLPGMVYRCRNDRDWTMEFASEGCLELTGYSAYDLIDNRTVSCAELIHPDDREMVWEEVQEAVREKKPFLVTYRIRTARGAEKWVWERGVGIFSKGGELEALEGFITDITERKKAEEDYEAATTLINKTFDSLDEAVFVVEPDTQTIIACNPAVEWIFGYKEKELTGRNTRLLHLDRQMFERFGREMREALETSGVFRTDYQLRRKDGRAIFSEHTVRAIAGGEKWGSALVSVVRDITDKKLADQELRRAHRELQEAYNALEKAQESAIASEKLASLGRLAAGVSHEILNPLNAIVINLHLLISSEETPEPITADLQEMLEQARRITKISQDLLYFSRQRIPERRRLDLNEVARRTIGLLEHELRLTNIAVEMRFDEELPAVHADEDQLQQVVLNILNNARDVMPKGGSLLIETRKAPESETDNGRAVELMIADSGPGVPPDIKDKLFDPFFTTKPVGVGTGLGLSICKGIIEAHGGQIWVENLQGGGAVFVLRMGAEEEQ